MFLQKAASRALPTLNSAYIWGFSDAVLRMLKDKERPFVAKYHKDLVAYEVPIDAIRLLSTIEPIRYADKGIEPMRRPCQKPALQVLPDDRYNYQTAAIEWLITQENALLRFDTQTGKTRVALQAADMLEGFVVVVCGQASLQKNWLEETAKLSLDKKYASFYKLAAYKERVKAIRQMTEQGLIINIESLRNSAIIEAIQAKSPEIFILDECQVLRGTLPLKETRDGYNVAAMKQGVFELDAPKRWALSATPVMNNIFEWQSILTWLRVIKSTKTAWQNYYGIWGFDRAGHRVCMEYIHEEDLKQLQEYICLDFRKEALGLPPIHVEDIRVEATRAEQQLFQDLKTITADNFYVRDPEDGTTIEVTSMPAKFAIWRYFSAAARGKQMFIAECLAKRKPIIVASMLVRPLERLADVLSDTGVRIGLYVGGNPVQQEKVLDAWHRNEYDLLLLSVKAGGMGLTLQEADTMIFIDAPENRSVWTQCMSRIYGVGQSKPCRIYNLLCGDLDEYAWQHLEEKEGWLDKFKSDGYTLTV